jgi:DNA-binding HxlR family transcriptional regulator
MEKKKTMEACSHKILAVRDALEIFSGKWKIPIIGALIYLEESGFKDLQRMVGDITPKMLSKELKELEMNHLVSRTVKDTRPVTVIYSITEYGKTCQSVIFELYNWGERHRAKIKEEMK